MPPPERKRCFECGASYPFDARACEEDHAPLWSDTINGVWRIEGVVSLRPGGATCAAYHLATGARVAIDVVRAPPLSPPWAVKLLGQEAQALRMLNHPSTLRLIEEGIDRSKGSGDGIHYLVTDLGTARPLADFLEEWQRAGGTGHGPTASAALIAAAVMGPVGRQLLGVLAAAHRIGLAHGSLGLAHVFILTDEESVTGFGRTSSLRLRGLRAIGPGPALREAIAADMASVSDILYELVAGKPPPASQEDNSRPKLPPEVDGKIAQLLLRGLGLGESPRFASADEMLRALLVAVPPTKREISAAALANLSRTDPQTSHPQPPMEPEAAAPSSDPALGGPPPLPRLTGPNALVTIPPATELKLGEKAGRSRLSGELHEASFRDLLEQNGSPRESGEETLARSRRRLSISRLPLSLSPELSGPSVPPVLPPSGEGATSAEELAVEPTLDLYARPFDFASVIPARRAPATPHEVKARPTPAPRPEPPLPSGPPLPGARAPLLEANIDPLAQTGRSPIPADVLEVSRKLQPQGAAPPGEHSEPAARPEPKQRPRESTEERLAPPAPASIVSLPEASATVGQRSLWQWLVLGTLLFAALLSFLLR